MTIGSSLVDRVLVLDEKGGLSKDIHNQNSRCLFNYLQLSKDSLRSIDSKYTNRIIILLDDISAAVLPNDHCRTLNSLCIFLKDESVSVDSEFSCHTEEHLLADIYVLVFKKLFSPILLNSNMRYLHRTVGSFYRSFLTIFNKSKPGQELLSKFSIEFAKQLSERIIIFKNRAIQLDATEKNDSIEVMSFIMDFTDDVDTWMTTSFSLFQASYHDVFLDLFFCLSWVLKWSAVNTIGNFTNFIKSEVSGLASTRDYINQDLLSTLEVKESENNPRIGNFNNGLKYLRFILRIISSFIHRHLSILQSYLSSLFSEIQLDIEDLAFSRSNILFYCTCTLNAVLMLLENKILPKDLMNAAGMLAVSLLTLFNPTTPILIKICHHASICEPIRPNDTAHLTEEFLYHFLEIFYLSNQKATENISIELEAYLKTVLSYLKPNGMFAVFKGFLGHFSSSSGGDCSHVVQLIELRSDKLFSDNNGSIIHNIIVQKALSYASNLTYPDTRFLAIQTLDAVIRYLHVIMKELDRQLRHIMKHSDNIPEISVRMMHLIVDSMIQRYDWKETIESSVFIIMNIWDDPTQQPFSLLYETFTHILSVNQIMKRNLVIIIENSELLSLTESKIERVRKLLSLGFFNRKQVLSRILHSNEDHRGRLQALLGFLKTVSPQEFFDCLGSQQRYSTEDNTNSPHDLESFSSMHLNFERLLPSFVCSCLNSISNPKLANVSGDILCCIIEKLENAEEPFQKLMGNCVIPLLSRAFCYPSEILFQWKNKSQYSVFHIISGIATHIVIPLTKKNPVILENILEHMHHLDQQDSERVRPYVFFSVVELLHRGKNASIVVDSYLHASSPYNFYIQHSLYMFSWEFRLKGLTLLIISKRNELIIPWQYELLISFLADGTFSTEESVTRNGIVAIFSKWIEQLGNSLLLFKSREFVDISHSIKYYSYATKKINLSDSPSSSFIGNEMNTTSTVSAEEYITKVLKTYIPGIMNIFIESIGRNTEESKGLSINRRYAAMLMYKSFLSIICPMLLPSEKISLLSSSSHQSPSSQDQEFYQKILSSYKGSYGVEDFSAILLPTSMISVLIECLGEGWELMRNVAAAILEFYNLYRPPLINLVSNLPSSLLDEARKDLDHHTFRRSEKGVLLYCLLLPVANSTEAQTELAHQIITHVSFHLDEMKEIINRAQKSTGMDELGRNLISHPFHGRLSVVRGLIARFLTSNLSPYIDIQQLKTIMNRVIEYCSEILIICSFSRKNHVTKGYRKLFSNASCDIETLTMEESWTRPSVDCRGHLFDVIRELDNKNMEFQTRMIINNAWLGIRSITRLIEELITPYSLDLIEVTHIQCICFALIETLLETKHNGVMRKTEQALQQLCYQLLTSQNPLLVAIPCTLIEYLFGSSGVKASSEARILRRSQGLPHAILPILRAEHAVKSNSLFSWTLGYLRDLSHRTRVVNESGKNLIVSNEDSDENRIFWRHCVNSLNILKFIVEDATFSQSITPYIEEFLLDAISGFDHEIWSVRNSSLMLFVSATQRAVGSLGSCDGYLGNISLYELASRMPQGLEFIQRKFQFWQDMDDNIIRGTHEMQIFPLLNFLSFLSPSSPHLLSSQSHGLEQLDYTTIIRFLRWSRRSKNCMIRFVSGNSLVAILNPESAIDEIHYIRKQLCHPVCSNEQHGILLHLHALLRTYVGPGVSEINLGKPKRWPMVLSIQIFELIVQVLLQWSRIPRASTIFLCNSSIISSYFSILTDIFHNVLTIWNHISSLSGLEHQFGSFFTEIRQMLYDLVGESLRILQIYLSFPNFEKSESLKKFCIIRRAYAASAKQEIAIFFVVLIDWIYSISKVTPEELIKSNKFLFLFHSILKLEKQRKLYLRPDHQCLLVWLASTMSKMLDGNIFWPAPVCVSEGSQEYDIRKIHSKHLVFQLIEFFNSLGGFNLQKEFYDILLDFFQFSNSQEKFSGPLKVVDILKFVTFFSDSTSLGMQIMRQEFFLTSETSLYNLLWDMIKPHTTETSSVSTTHFEIFRCLGRITAICWIQKLIPSQNEQEKYLAWWVQLSKFFSKETTDRLGRLTVVQSFSDFVEIGGLEYLPTTCLILLLNLIYDDDADIRELACKLTSDCNKDSNPVNYLVPCITGAALTIVNLIQKRNDLKQHELKDLINIETSDSETDDEDDVLFAKDSENPFREPRVMKNLVEMILDPSKEKGFFLIG